MKSGRYAVCNPGSMRCVRRLSTKKKARPWYQRGYMVFDTWKLWQTCHL